MKNFLSKSCSVLLAMIIIISSMPLSAFSLTARQQEDFYRVNTWWQDAENKEFIDWLLESDNFLYHLDITEGDIIHDMSYAGLNLNAKERKDNFVQILTSFIGLSYDEIREASAAEAFSDMSMEFLNGFEDYLEATELYTVEQFEYMSKAIKETSDYYLNHYYGINTDMDQYGYETIYQRIQSAFDNRVQNFDFPDRKAETMDAFFDFVASSEWLNKLSSISNVFSLVGDGLNIAQEGFALLGEVESYEKTDERLIELLKYIRSRTTDSALRAACDEIIVKFDNSYTENIVAGVLELLDEGIVDLTFDIAKEMIVGKCGIYNLFAKVGITAGNVVSDIWFNTTETKYQMQTIYCLNEISELLVPLLDNELDDLFYYDEVSEFRANYAADAIYHINLLIELRKLGEESYYKLKDSAYSSNIITACKTLGWTNLSKDEHVIDAWYSEFTSVMEAVEVWLFKTIPANYYYEEPKPALYEIKNSKLVSYNGTSTSVYLPTSSPKTNYDTIAENAFKDNETIISVHIPYSVKKIEAYAFNNCTNLKSVTINEVDVIIAENAFYNCNAELTIYGYENSTAYEFAIANNINFVSLYSEYDEAQNFTDPDFVIEDGVLVDYLGDGGDVYIPYGVTEIGERAFEYCFSLTSIVIPDTVTLIGYAAFYYCIQLVSVTIPDSVVYIGEKAFYCCEQLTSVTMPNSITHIGEEAFCFCEQLVSVTIPDSVTYIGDGAFCFCDNLREIKVHHDNNYYCSENGVLFNKDKTTIIAYPIGKSEVTYVIPDGVTKISNSAFQSSHLISVLIPNSVIEIADYAFEQSVQLTSIVIPDGVTKIGQWAFGNCSGLTSIVIPDTVTSIGYAAFYYCKQLVSVTIPDSVTYIGECAFSHCTRLVKVTLGNSVISIEEYTFSDCTSLIDVTFLSDVESISYYAFKNCNEDIIFYCYPVSSAEDYALRHDFSIAYLGSGIDINTMPYKTKYPIDGNLNVDGLTLNFYGDDGRIVTISSGYTIGDYDFSSAGTKTIEVFFGDFKTTFEITVDASIYEYPESEHPYSHNTNQTWNYIHPTNCSSLKITFSESTQTESDYDWIYIYDGDGNQIGEYCGTDLSGQTVEVAGNKFSIKLTSDSSKTDYGFSITQIIAICEHSFGDWITRVEPSCTTVGNEYQVCNICGKESSREIASLGHDYSNGWVIDKDATCTTAGLKYKQCLRCLEKTEMVEIPASHTWSAEWTIDVMPTETTDGSKSHHCLYCDEKTDITVIPKLDSESPATDFKYTIKNGEVTIDKYIGSNEVMSIPSHIDGYPVTAIKSFAFSNNTTIKKAIIPYTVKDLNFYAFYNCTELLEVKIGNGITTISENCFSNCSKLQKVSLPENLITIKDGAFYYCENLTEITLPDTVEVIEEMAFYRCTALTYINIPDSTYGIGEKALYKTPWFENLTGDYVILGSGVLIKIANEFGKDVVIPEGVQTIYSDAFEESYVDVVYIPSTLKNWSMSTTFTVSAYVVNSDNPYLCVYDGVLYNAEKTHLLSAPSNLTGTIILPSTVVSIGNNAFYSSNLSEVILNEGLLEIGENAFYFANTKVNIPNTVVTIGDSAFSYCYGITDVVIPQSVTNIGSWAFSGCSNLQSIHFLTINCSIYDSSYTFPTNIVLYGCPNSTAQVYAEKYDRNFISMHNIIDGVCSVCGSHSEIIFVDEDMHIEGLDYGVNSLSDIEDKINIDNAYIKAYNIDGVELTDTDLVGTGAKVYVYDSVSDELLNAYTIVLYGDVNGDGLINDTDKDIITSVATCTGTIDNKWFLMAADTNHDGAVDGFDVIETDLQALDMHNIEQKNTIAYLSKDETEDETEAA